MVLIQTHLFVTSVTCNACALLFLLMRFGISSLINYLARKQKVAEKWQDLNERRSWILPKFFTEQLVTWILIICGACALCLCSVLKSPFLPLDDQPAVFIIFSINIGRYAFKIVQDFTLLEKTPLFCTFVIHHSVALACYATAVFTKEMALVGILGLFMEADVIWYDLARVMKQAEVPRYKVAYLMTNTANCFFTLLARIVLPSVLLGVAISRQNPMAMSSPSLAVFFMSLVYVGCINLYILRRSALALKTTIEVRDSQCYQPMVNPLSSCVIQPGSILSGGKNYKNVIKNNTSDSSHAAVHVGPDEPVILGQPTLSKRLNDAIRLPPSSNLNICNNNNLDTVSVKGTSKKQSVEFAIAVHGIDSYNKQNNPV